ncbi:hypothetical protein BH09PAT4_BH09PAT4_05450 [soil metagenome]
MARQKQNRSLQHYTMLVIAYVVLSFVIPLNRATREAYNLDLTQAHIIAFITVLPLFGIWFIAFYCYGLLQRYATSIHKAREGFAFKKLADGVAVLSWGIVIQAFASLILNGIADQIPSFHGGAIVLQNYFALAFPLVAFTAISTGTRHLLLGKQNYASLPTSRLLLILFSLVAAVYSYLVLHLRSTGNGNAFYLPTFLLISTVVVPYLYAWFSGLIAAYDIHLYARVTHGLLYKRSLGLLSAGLIVLIVASILMQYLNSLLLTATGNVSLNVMLLLDYVLLIGIGAGYGLMAKGIRGLQRIEEI